MKKNILIFDVDGVLFDSIGIAKASLIEGYPGMTDEMYKDLGRGNFHENLKNIPVPKIERTEEEATNRRILFAQKKLAAQMFPGAKELLVWLRENGYTLCINSSAYERNLLPLLKKAQITEMFNFIGTAEMSKSKHEKFEMIETKYHAESNDLLFITDTIGDVKEAELKNIPTVAVSWGAHDRNDFMQETSLSNIVAIVDTFEELKEHIVMRK